MTSQSDQAQTFKKLALLDATKILICRPEPSATELSQALESMGAICQKLPMLTIEPKELSAIERQSVLDLDQYQHVIVVSQHAAQLALDEIDHYWPQAPVRQKWYAIGRKTAQVLTTGSLDILPPEQDLTSEALLEKKDLKAVTGDRVLILKGEGGRDVIFDELSARGAKVDTISFYTRSKTQYTNDTLVQSLDDFNPDYIVALSGETLSNLIAQCQEQNIDLSQRSFILSSNRVANIAYEHGIKQVLIPENLMPMDIVRCIKKAK